MSNATNQISLILFPIFHHLSLEPNGVDFVQVAGRGDGHPARGLDNFLGPTLHCARRCAQFGGGPAEGGRPLWLLLELVELHGGGAGHLLYQASLPGFI